jgi:hypothetical protein
MSVSQDRHHGFKGLSRGYKNGYSTQPVYFQQLEKDKFLRRLYVYSQFALITVDYGVRSGLLGTPHEAPFWRVFRVAWKFTTASLGASLAAI